MNDNKPLPEQLPVDERLSVAKFAMSLLSFSLFLPNENRLVCSVVTSFNRNLFLDCCGRSGLNYDAQLCDFDQISSVLFKAGVTWTSRQVLFDAIYDVGQRHGFEPIKNGREILCSRVPLKKKERVTEAQKDCVTKQHGCTFSLMLVPLCVEKYRDAKERLQQKVLWNEPVYISQSCTLHGGLCEPSVQNLVNVRSSSGTYLRKLPHNAIYSLCRVMDSGERLNVKNVTNANSPGMAEEQTHYQTHSF